MTQPDGDTNPEDVDTPDDSAGPVEVEPAKNDVVEKDAGSKDEIITVDQADEDSVEFSQHDDGSDTHFG